MSEGTAAAAMDGIDLIEYLRIIRRRWLLILLCIAVTLGLVAFVTFRMTKIYRATTTVRIETQAPQVLGDNVEDVVEMGTGSFWSNIEYYETQYKIIESRKVALRVVEEFNLHENADFMQLPPAEMPVSKEDAADQLKALLTVEPVKDSRLVYIHIDHRDPKKAQLYADAIATSYVRLNLENMHARTLEAVDWLGERLDGANSKLKESETELLKFKKDHNILSISLEDRQSHITAQMQTAAQNLTEAKSRRIALQSRKKAVSAVAGIDDPLAIPVSALNDNPLIQQLKQQYTELNQEYGELSARYGDNFPKMVEIKARMGRIRDDIHREVKNVIDAIDAELQEAKLTETGLQTALSDLEKQAQALADKKGDYNDLARTVENNEQVYRLLTGRSEEAKLTRFLQVNNVDILDHAVVPDRPIKPRVLLNLAIALLIGTILGIALAILIEVADRSIKTQDDIEALGVPFLGIVPSIDTADAAVVARAKREGQPVPEEPAEKRPQNYDQYIHAFPKSQVAESLRSIRTNLLFMSAGRQVRRILVTSPSPQEGKTTFACNLAIAMAQSGSRVLLVDTDLRRPRIHRAFDIPRPVRGMSTMVLRESGPEDSIVPSPIPNLDILPCGPTPPNPSELMHTDAFADVVNRISASYDRVIFDSPPIGVVTDAAILSKMVDGTLLILKSLKTTRDTARHAISTLRDINAPVLGAVLNGLDLMNRRYGRYYYHYYSQYGAYYAEGAADRSLDAGVATDKQE